MKKFSVGLIFVIAVMLFGLTVFAAGNTICIMPEDFGENKGTFVVNKEGENVGGFRRTTLRGTTSRQPGNSIPAQIAFEVKEAGDYTVYVHSRDFNTETGQRYFRVAVDKNSLSNKKLGAHAFHGWQWENAGTLTLDKGAHVLKVYDSSGFYARTDMIIITSDKDVKLPETDTDMRNVMEKNRVVVSEAELEEFLRPNQVFRNGYFYTAATVEEFNQIGTWKYERNTWINNDTPLKDRYLMGVSAKDGVETENAVITFAVPKDGEYYLWVRTKDFAENQGIRLFDAIVDGVVLDTKFGDHGVDGWAWERVLIGTLKKGYHVLEFADTHKNFARFDMFGITDDKEFVPDSKQINGYKFLQKAGFAPEEVVPDMACPVKAEPIGNGTKTYPMRPSTEYAVSINGTYFECKTDFSGKYPMVSAKDVFCALNGTLSYETENSVCFTKDGKAYLFTAGDTFCLNGKKKIEMRSAASISDGVLMIPASFLSKLDNVKVKNSGKDIEITHRIWK